MRKLTGWVRWLAGAVAVGLAAFQLYTAATGVLEPMHQRPTNLVFVLVLAFLLFPARKGSPRARPSGVDWALAVGAVAVYAYLLWDHARIVERTPYVDALLPRDYAGGFAAVALVLEATRRAAGWPLPLFALLAMAYPFVWPTGIRFELVMDQTFLTTEGIFGIPLGVAATVVFAFLVFTSLLEHTRLGDSFIEVAKALIGLTKGGPGKTEVVSSAFFGTISGSSVANVYGTGTFTIPLMKQAGYTPHFAAAVEAVSSVGGQIMPPVMGAGAFIMADYLRVPYLEVAKLAAIPAVLYFLAVYAMVHFEAQRLNLGALKEVPPLWPTLRKSVHLWVPIGVLVGMLVAGYSGMMAALWAAAVTIPATLLRRASRLTPGQVLRALEGAGRQAVMISTACAAAGIVVGIINVTGLGVTFASTVTRAAGGMLPLALVLVAAASLVLGLGVPTSAAYIMVAVIAAPALQRMGVDPAAAHLFCFYFAVLAPITPPDALAAYAAAQIAGANPMQTAWTAMRLGTAAYLVPFFFVNDTGMLLKGPWGNILLAAGTAVLGSIVLAAGIQGWLLRRTTGLERLLLLAGGVLLMKPGWVTDLVGLALLATAWGMQRWVRPAAQARAEPAR